MHGKPSGLALFGPDRTSAHVRNDLQVVTGHVADGERVERLFAEIQRKEGMLVPIAWSALNLACTESTVPVPT